MPQPNKNTFSKIDNPQLIWEVYAELLDFYFDQPFNAKQLAYEINLEISLVNKILHRLAQHKAVICTGKDHWGVTTYTLNNDFKT